MCSGKLGALNHALLSIEALKHRDMDLAGVVYNYCAEADPVIDKDTPRMIGRAMRQAGYPPALVRLGKWETAASNDVEAPSHSAGASARRYENRGLLLPDFTPIFPEVRP